MFKIIGADEKEYGPVTAEQIRQWIQENRANAETRVQVEGNQEWIPLGRVPEFATDLSSLRQAVTPPPPFDSHLGSAAYPRAAEREMDISHCIVRGWELLKDHPGLILSAHFLVAVIILGTAAISGVGVIVNLIVFGPLYGGLYLLCLRLAREQPASLGDLLAGFGPSFLQLMLGQIVTWILIMLSSIFFVMGLAVLFFMRNVLPGALAYVLCFAGLLPILYLTVAWLFTLPLIIDKQMEFWPAMELSRQTAHAHFWSLLGLVIMGSLIASAGLLLFGVGIFITFPVFFGAVVYAYEDLLGAAG